MNRSLSPLTLGTVQLGMPYGIANRSSQPDYARALKIVRTAVEGGITVFDTAAAYGTSEEVLGKALRELNALDQVMVVTKLKPLGEGSPTGIRVAMQESIRSSQRLLGLDPLPMLLFHRQADVQYLDELLRLQAEGQVLRIGLSCESGPAQVHRLIEKQGVEALQIPASIFDRRHQHAGVFQQASLRGVQTFVRSVFLQGLAFLPEADIPAQLQPVIPLRRALTQVAGKAGMELPELALRYLLGRPGISSVLVGAETPEQIQTNIGYARYGCLPPDLRKAIEEAPLDIPEEVLSPTQWKSTR